MNRARILFFIMSILLLFATNLSANVNEDYKPGDNSYFSLLTASPGTAAYKHYGHTGIRFHDPEKPIDIVFNYGLFDFSSPNFLLRFVTGKTDYLVAPFSYYDFLLEYKMENRSVTEQVLNFNKDEISKLWNALVINIRPGNREYRYNFFYENCSTKPRDIIESTVNGKIDYQWEGKYKSLREEVHHFTAKHPWTRFGIDFALGAKADDISNLRVQQFAPDVLMESFSKAVIVGNSNDIRPLVKETTQLITIDTDLVIKSQWLPDPVLVMWLVFLITLFFTWLEIKNKKQNLILNSVLYTVAGLLGLVIAFLVFLSEHPTTEVNYQLLWLNPVYLIYLPGLLSRRFRRRRSFLIMSLMIPLQVYALAGTLFLPQVIHPASYPLLMALMLRTISGYIYYRNNNEDQ